MGISTRMIQELWINIRGRMTQESWFMASYLQNSKVYMWLGRMIKDLWINIRDGMTKESWLMIHDLWLRINREEEYNWELIGWCRSCESILEVGWLRNCDSCGPSNVIWYYSSRYVADARGGISGAENQSCRLRCIQSPTRVCLCTPLALSFGL